MRKKNERTLANGTKWLLGALGAFAGLIFLRTLPDLVRYVKIERM